MFRNHSKKFKHIQNKAIPSPLRPKFRNSKQTNIYFLSKEKNKGKNDLLFKKVIIVISLLSIVLIVYFF